jgi:hypothetical protein
LKVIKDDKRHISTLNGVLEELREITGAKDNKGLIEAAKALFGKNTSDDV